MNKGKIAKDLKVSLCEDGDMHRFFSIISDGFKSEHEYFNVVFPGHETPEGRKIGGERMLDIKKKDPNTVFLEGDRYLDGADDRGRQMEFLRWLHPSRDRSWDHGVLGNAGVGPVCGCHVRALLGTEKGDYPGIEGSSCWYVLSDSATNTTNKRKRFRVELTSISSTRYALGGSKASTTWGWSHAGRVGSRGDRQARCGGKFC